MQSVPFERSITTESIVDHPHSQQLSTQHGLFELHESSSEHSNTRGGSAASTALSESDALSISSGSSTRERCGDLRRLSSRDNSPRGLTNLNRIDEYERSHSGTPRKQKSLLFQIIPGDTVSNVSLEDFPNEVLTHLLSHLSPSSLSAMSLVSKRFHDLITTPHAWRIAFSRYFPGPESLLVTSEDPRYARDDQQILKSDRRSFSRLSALASWRSEYILRTRLLRSLGRGKPAQYQSLTRAGQPRHASAAQATAVTTYGSNLLYPVSHIHATFGTGLNKKQPLFMHGASEQGISTASDPAVGKVDKWGVNDFQAFKHFADLYVGDAEYGLGRGDVVGMPNVMDLSQPYGKVYGEACPGGRVFFTSIGEQRGRFLPIQSTAHHDLGIPEVSMLGCAVSSVWVAKSESILKMTGGILGMLAGFSNGVLSAYAIGSSPLYDRRFEKGEPTARWVLSPGVPIISIQVDEQYSTRRSSQSRIWAAVLNALGEVFYLTDIPTRPETKVKIGPEEIDRVSWATGRTCQWTLIEATRRVAKVDPFNTDSADGSYSPRSSSNALGLSKEQLIAETHEIEQYLSYPPKHFQKICEGWDMRRTLLVDFAGDDRNGAGESLAIINFGFDERHSASIRRLTRRKFKLPRENVHDQYPAIQSSVGQKSLFGGPALSLAGSSMTPSPRSTPRSRTSSQEDLVQTPCTVEWFLSDFTFGGLRSCQISASAIDSSTFAVLTTSEDPLLSMNGGSSASSPISSPFGHTTTASSVSDIPGQRGRFFAVGLMTGIVILWDIRASVAPASDIINSVAPIRIIYTESPQISSLALTSLYVVHGGNDGLVQAWDPLASSTQPVRTLNSRFSSRARRRLVQAEMSVHGVGNNYYAAGAIALDPDPTVLRGMVSLGTHLRYWSYSSSAADQYKSNKRKLRRRSERGSNAAHNEQHFTHSGRGALKDYIATEKFEMEREKMAKRKELEHLSGRFGTDLLGPDASEEEMLAYATMLSQEAFSVEEVRRQGSSETSTAVSTASGGTETISGHDSSLPLFDDTSSRSSPMTEPNDPNLDPDIAEAIRLSLLDQQDTQGLPDDYPASSLYAQSPVMDVPDIPIRYSKKSSRHTQPSSSSAWESSEISSDEQHETGATQDSEESDLDFAIRLSLAEEQSRNEDLGISPSAYQGDQTWNVDEYPALERNTTVRKDDLSGNGKGKGKGKAAW